MGIRSCCPGTAGANSRGSLMTPKSPAPQVHIETFGCQMNESDSELVRSLLKREGFAFTEDRERADVVL
ncbi:MAG TPA: hypothetical protein VLE03_09450, partial [Nitrospiraceae bacterium]|nr:hypothetical protein [Nitrospiraceae bacterium]